MSVEPSPPSGALNSPPGPYVPILLPPSSATPPEITKIQTPPADELPPDMSPIDDQAEQFAVTDIEAFTTAHLGATLKVTDHISGGMLMLTVSGRSGNNTFTYTVTETKNSVDVAFTEHDGLTEITLTAAQAVKSDVGDLVLTNYAGKHLTQFLELADIKGDSMAFQFQAPTTMQGV